MHSRHQLRVDLRIRSMIAKSLWKIIHYQNAVGDMLPGPQSETYSRLIGFEIGFEMNSGGNMGPCRGHVWEAVVESLG